MFVNASFFTNQCKSKIHFDKNLVIGEDQKVVLTILKDNMKYGVVTGCKYMYRRRSVGESGLISSSKKKYGWYFDYFTYLIDWGIKEYKEKYGYLPAFIQYQFLCDLQWRVKENYDPLKVLSVEESNLYLCRLWEIFRKFDDKYILEQEMIQTEYKNFILYKKYYNNIQLKKVDNDVLVQYGQTVVGELSKTQTVIEFININNDTMSIAGLYKIYGVSLEEKINIFINLNGELIKTKIDNSVDFNETRFGELLLRVVPFKANITLPKCRKNIIELVVKIRDYTITLRKIRFGKYFPLVNNLKKSYVNLGDYYISYKDYKLLLYRKSFLIKIKNELMLF